MRESPSGCPSRPCFSAPTVDLNGLTLLVQIIDSGNLSKAARQLNMSRANVSYHLNQFEQAVGQQLLRRTTRRLEPTEIGLKLYEHGVAIRNELLAARESVTALGQQLQGRVRLSVPSGYGQVVRLMKDHFVVVAPRKPKASRDRSAETYLLGRRLKQSAAARGS